MSDKYFFYGETNIIECLTYKAAYQLCRQMYRHRFYCKSEIISGNTRVIHLHKCKTDIIIYVYNQLREPITNTVVTYNDYIQKVVKRHEKSR